jgi:preprotein translocase subunit SecD
MRPFTRLSLLFLLLASACSVRDSHHQPGTAARYLIVVKVSPSAGSSAKEAMDEVYPQLLNRLKNAGITYQKTEADEAARTLSFYLIDGPAQAEKQGADRMAYFREALTMRAKLEFWDTYRNNDAELVDAFVQMGATHAFFRYVLMNQNYELGSPAVIGVANEDVVPMVDSLLALPEVKGLFPKDIAFKWSRTADGIRELYGIKTPDAGAPLTEKHLEYAKGGLNDRGGPPVVNLKFNAQGAKIWEQMTARAAQNQNREIAIVFNDEVISAPRVMSPISGGQSMLSGNFTMQEVQDMELQFRLAQLGHSLSILEARAL